MLNFFQHLTKSWTYETLKRVQGDRLGLFTRPSKLGKIANDEALKQGRHRGKNPGVLLDATEGELKEAGGIARNLVDAYLGYLGSLN